MLAPVESLSYRFTSAYAEAPLLHEAPQAIAIVARILIIVDEQSDRIGFGKHRRAGGTRGLFRLGWSASPQHLTIE